MSKQNWSLFRSLFLAVIVSSGQAWAKPTFELNEDKLVELAGQTSAPDLSKIQSTLLLSQTNESMEKEKFAPEMYGSASQAENHARPIIPFQPIFTPVRSAQIGVKQNVGGGIQASADVTTVEQSAAASFGNFNKVTSTVLAFTMQMDLWKDLFGRLSNASLENATLDAKRASYESQIQTKTFSNTVRKLYWALVANKESLAISNELLKTAEQQAAEARKRYEHSIAEEDEVARYEAQVSSRQGSLLYLRYQKEIYLRQLKALLPALNEYELEIGSYDIDATVNKVLVCTQLISSKQGIPFDFTSYDEMTDLLKQIRNNNDKINKRYSDIDLKLFGTVRETGVGSDQTTGSNYQGSYGRSFGDFNGNNRSAYEVGLKFSLPLGSKKANTKQVKELYDQKRLASAIDGNDALLTSTHEQLVKSIALLKEVIHTQKINSKQLQKRLEIVKRKYNQARVSVNDMISDQDALLNSRLSTISTQTEVLSLLFNYLVVYTETPCEFNRTK